MIAELPDGTKLRLPDSLSDSQVDAIVRPLIAAQRSLALLQERVDAMQVSLSQRQDSPALVQALVDLRADLNAGLDRVVKAQLADTVITDRNAEGDGVRSKKVISD